MSIALRGVFAFVAVLSLLVAALLTTQIFRGSGFALLLPYLGLLMVGSTTLAIYAAVLAAIAVASGWFAVRARA